MLMVVVEFVIVVVVAGAGGAEDRGAVHGLRVRQSGQLRLGLPGAVRSHSAAEREAAGVQILRKRERS